MKIQKFHHLRFFPMETRDFGFPSTYIHIWNKVFLKCVCRWEIRGLDRPRVFPLMAQLLPIVTMTVNSQGWQQVTLRPDHRKCLFVILCSTSLSGWELQLLVGHNYGKIKTEPQLRLYFQTLISIICQSQPVTETVTHLSAFFYLLEFLCYWS